MTTTDALEDLASYVPALILRRMAVDISSTMAPAADCFPAAALFADLSGFTALTEQFSLHNPAGTEELTQILDLYFGHLVRVVTAHGGDVVKFAGDGLLALWYGDEDLPQLAQRAVQCGLAVQMMMSPDVWGGSFDGARAPAPLKLRVGVGAGEVTTMHIGGVFGRWELLVTGEPVRQTGHAEGQARPGDVVIAAEAWPLVAHACVGTPLPSGAVRLESLSDYLPMRGLELPPLRPEMAAVLRAYLPKAILARMDAGQTAWLAEQRQVTVLFVNLPGLRADTPLRKAQALMRAIQAMLYRFEGSVSRLGADGKGPTLVAALGLPPLAHEDDPERGARAALAIQAALADMGCACAIGVTTGQALCSAVGGAARREYTMMGSIVNRSARLMQAAAGQAARDGGLALLCDAATAHAAGHRLRFDPLSPLALKGVSELVPIYRPQAGSAKPPQAHEPPPQAGAHGIITSRIDRLTPAQQLTLKVASVIGQSFTLTTLSAIHPVERDTARLIDQLFMLQQAGLVVVDFDPLITDTDKISYAFKHAVASEVAYNLMSYRQRRQLHRALAERYEAGDEPTANAALLAHHWRQAGDLPRAMGYLAVAGERSLRAGAYGEAASQLHAAIQIAAGLPPGGGAPDPATLAGWERQLGEAHQGMGRLNEGRHIA
ncbi:MAG: adenylate/guanylate cyclase domain-containing protein [Chloroflexales bacterium]